jgi:hypothetical protein
VLLKNHGFEEYRHTVEYQFYLLSSALTVLPLCISAHYTEANTKVPGFAKRTRYIVPIGKEI